MYSQALWIHRHLQKRTFFGKKAHRRVHFRYLNRVIILLTIIFLCTFVWYQFAIVAFKKQVTRCIRTSMLAKNGHKVNSRDTLVLLPSLIPLYIMWVSLQSVNSLHRAVLVASAHLNTYSDHSLQIKLPHKWFGRNIRHHMICYNYLQHLLS